MPSSVERHPDPPLYRAARQTVALVLIAVVPAVLTGWLHPRRPAWPGADGAIPEITLADARALTPPVIWVDARAGEAFATQHIPGAVNLTETDWDQGLAGFVDVWRPGRPVVVYCASHRCDTSRSVAGRLRRELRITGVYVLKGGWEAWQGPQR